MPVYEYRCMECRRRFSMFWRSFAAAETGQAVCPHCHATHAQRLVSRVRLLRSEDSRMEELADPDRWGSVDENDPKSMGRFMRKMMNEMGDEAGDLGPGFGEVIDRLEAGQDPEQIEKEVPDLMEGGDMPPDAGEM
jgi:putative FmdB family regulatory protein